MLQRIIPYLLPGAYATEGPLDVGFGMGRVGHEVGGVDARVHQGRGDLLERVLAHGDLGWPARILAALATLGLAVGSLLKRQVTALTA
ncbi:hypothetical protein [Streptomyces mirabilis]|uniref:hypothetical protein n=1 Tax=Streptomyces mirabilis TaxID=68239 RepID=UPI0036D16509